MDTISRVLMACALLLLAVAGALLFSGCGSHQSGAYDPGPPGAGHWRPAEVTTDTDAYERALDTIRANVPGVPTVDGRLGHFGMNCPGGLIDNGAAANGDYHVHDTFRMLPSGRVATHCYAADLQYHVRDCVYDGKWLVLADRCRSYDEASDTVVWDVAMSRKAR